MSNSLGDIKVLSFSKTSCGEILLTNSNISFSALDDPTSEHLGHLEFLFFQLSKETLYV
jgi:hypothetical protein